MDSALWSVPMSAKSTGPMAFELYEVSDIVDDEMKAIRSLEKNALICRYLQGFTDPQGPVWPFCWLSVIWDKLFMSCCSAGSKGKADSTAAGGQPLGMPALPSLLVSLHVALHSAAPWKNRLSSTPYLVINNKPGDVSPKCVQAR